LKVFTLEEKARADNCVEGVRRQHWCAVNAWRDARVSFADGLPRGRLIERGFNLWSGAHGKSRGFVMLALVIP
jgi:hypothetical protein